MFGVVLIGGLSQYDRTLGGVPEVFSPFFDFFFFQPIGHRTELLVDSKFSNQSSIDFLARSSAPLSSAAKWFSLEQSQIVNGDNFAKRTGGHVSVQNHSTIVVHEERTLVFVDLSC